MPELQPQPAITNETIPVQLRLDPKVHDFFLNRAQKAGVGLESYLSSTLALVLGCKAFGAMSVCSPSAAESTCSPATER